VVLRAPGESRAGALLLPKEAMAGEFVHRELEAILNQPPRHRAAHGDSWHPKDRRNSEISRGFRIPPRARKACHRSNVPSNKPASASQRQLTGQGS
jgi:hypothetical protein